MAPSRFSDIAAIILAGGQSSRMQQDKAWINYHGKPQVLWLYDVLQHLGLQVGISAGTADLRLDNRSVFPDLPGYSNHGPIGGVLSTLAGSGHRGALLLIGCDYPLFGSTEICHLLQSRRPDATATVYAPEGRALPFPAIWEKEALDRLRTYFDTQHYSMQGLLAESMNQLNVIAPISIASLQSADTPGDMKRIQAMLQDNGESSLLP